LKRHDSFGLAYSFVREAIVVIKVRHSSPTDSDTECEAGYQLTNIQQLKNCWPNNNTIVKYRAYTG